jgi:hypothetical protein
MASSVRIVHPSGLERDAYQGFSWTTLFFGPFPALFRGDLVGAALIFFTAILAGIIIPVIGSFLVCVVFAAIYNQQHFTRLIEQGYRVKGQ